MIEINPQKIDYTKRISEERKSPVQNPKKLVNNLSKGQDFIFRGGLSLQAEFGKQNVERFQRFLTTPNGKLFVAQQAILQSLNPKRGTRIYNPLAPVISKALPQELTHLKPKRHLDVGDGGLIGTFRNLIGKGEPQERTENAVKFFSRKNPSKTMDLQVRYGGTENMTDYPTRTMTTTGKGDNDFIKFRIRDAVNRKWIIFPALLDGGITDNSSTSPSTISYIGRADKVHIYGGYTRTISFAIDVVAQRESDIAILWEKINYAKGLVLPKYQQFFGKNDSSRPVAPIIYLTLGDLFNNTPGFFTSVNLTIPANSTWELENGRQVPHLAKLAFDFTYIGKETPENRVGAKHFDNISDLFKHPPEELTKVDDTVADPKSKREMRREQRTARREDRKGRREQRRLDRKSFGEAFKKKRAELGANKTFTWRGKQYNTNRADD
tara:strand:+ start:1294 stop:2607 length:1314 start_codon:yes stop_codon:yes gene_type:complete